MKSVLRRFFVILLLVISTTLYFPCDNAQAGVIDDITQVYDSAKRGGKDYFCRKGDITQGIFSARSFKGNLCNYSTAMSALTEYVCTNPNVADFEGSSCDTYAKRNLKGEDPKAVLAREAITATGPVGKLINLFYKP